MKTFKEQLAVAQQRHLELQKERISDFYVAVRLWEGSPPKSQRVLLSRALNEGVTLKIKHLKILMDVFPDTPVSEWVNVKPKNDE